MVVVRGGVQRTGGGCGEEGKQRGGNRWKAWKGKENVRPEKGR